MLVNLEVDLPIRRRSLLAPPPSATWELMWSSEDPVYGGSGTPTIYSADNPLLPGAACVVSGRWLFVKSQGGPSHEITRAKQGVPVNGRCGSCSHLE